MIREMVQMYNVKIRQIAVQGNNLQSWEIIHIQEKRSKEYKIYVQDKNYIKISKYMRYMKFY
jgi:hypothetical protein